MKHTLAILVFSLILSYSSGQGKVLQSQKFKSNILNKEVNYSVYLPEGFEQSQQNYPVIYLLHGYGNDENTWISEAKISEQMDKAIKERLITPAVIVMPDGDTSWYVNVKARNYNWEEMFIKEFIPGIEKQYRINSTPARRAIWGNSMGGFAAVRYAMTYPELFGISVGFSPAVYPDAQIGDRYQVSESPLHIIQNTSADQLNKVRYYLDCGDRDFIYWGFAQLNMMMNAFGINHESYTHPGEHCWPYWKEGVENALKFIAKNFKTAHK